MRKATISTVGMTMVRVVLCLLLAEAFFLGGLFLAVSLWMNDTDGQAGEGAGVSALPATSEEIIGLAAEPDDIASLIGALEPKAADDAVSWFKTYGGSDSDYFNSVTPTSDGGFVAVGSSNSADGDLPDRTERDYSPHIASDLTRDFDFVVARFDANGDKLWLRNYGGSGSDIFRSVVSTPDGGFVAVGESDSVDGDLLGNKGRDDFVIAKIDANGDAVWFKTYGGGGYDWLCFVASTVDGGFVAVGNSSPLIDNYSSNDDWEDFVVTRFGANGEKLWFKTYGGSVIDSFRFVTPTLDGDFVAVGHSYSKDGDLPGNKGDNDFVIARFDA
jgi:hypothetical protein